MPLPEQYDKFTADIEEIEKIAKESGYEGWKVVAVYARSYAEMRADPRDNEAWMLG